MSQVGAPSLQDQDASTELLSKSQTSRQYLERKTVNAEAIARRRLHLSKAKLKVSSRTSALLAGFAMVAMVELQLDNKNESVPRELLLSFTICTVLLVSTHLLALMISTCILPYVDAVAANQDATIEEIHESPHIRMSAFVEIAWTLSNVFGIFLFLLEVIVICWVRFWSLEGPNNESGRNAAWVATLVLIPIIVIFVAFAVHFYRKLTTHRVERAETHLKDLENVVNDLDSHLESAQKTLSVHAFYNVCNSSRDSGESQPLTGVRESNPVLMV